MAVTPKMTLKEYRDRLKAYTLTALGQVGDIASLLELQTRNKLTVEEGVLLRAGLKALTISSERTEEILDQMRYEWEIFEGENIKFSPLSNKPLSVSSIAIGNLKNLKKAAEDLIEEKHPHQIKFLFQKGKIFVQVSKKKMSSIGELGTYQEGLLKALSNPVTARVGVIRRVETVLEIMAEYRKFPALSEAEERPFLRGVFREIQRKMKEAHLGGILTLKWLDNDSKLQIVAKTKMG